MQLYCDQLGGSMQNTERSNQEQQMRWHQREVEIESKKRSNNFVKVLKKIQDFDRHMAFDWRIRPNLEFLGSQKERKQYYLNDTLSEKKQKNEWEYTKLHHSNVIKKSQQEQKQYQPKNDNFHENNHVKNEQYQPQSIKEIIHEIENKRINNNLGYNYNNEKKSLIMESKNSVNQVEVNENKIIFQLNQKNYPYRQLYQDLKERLRRQSQWFLKQQQKFVTFSNSENQFRIEFMRIKLKYEETQKQLDQKNEKLKQMKDLLMNRTNSQKYNENQNLLHEKRNFEATINLQEQRYQSLKKQYYLFKSAANQKALQNQQEIRSLKQKITQIKTEAISEIKIFEGNSTDNSMYLTHLKQMLAKQSAISALLREQVNNFAVKQCEIKINYQKKIKAIQLSKFDLNLQLTELEKEKNCFQIKFPQLHQEIQRIKSQLNQKKFQVNESNNKLSNKQLQVSQLKTELKKNMKIMRQNRDTNSSLQQKLQQFNENDVDEFKECKKRLFETLNLLEQEKKYQNELKIKFQWQIQALNNQISVLSVKLSNYHSEQLSLKINLKEVKDVKTDTDFIIEQQKNEYIPHYQRLIGQITKKYAVLQKQYRFLKQKYDLSSRSLDQLTREYEQNKRIIIQSKTEIEQSVNILKKQYERLNVQVKLKQKIINEKEFQVMKCRNQFQNKVKVLQDEKSNIRQQLQQKVVFLKGQVENKEMANKIIESKCLTFQELIKNCNSETVNIASNANERIRQLEFQLAEQRMVTEKEKSQKIQTDRQRIIVVSLNESKEKQIIELQSTITILNQHYLRAVQEIKKLENQLGQAQIIQKQLNASINFLLQFIQQLDKLIQKLIAVQVENIEQEQFNEQHIIFTDPRFENILIKLKTEIKNKIIQKKQLIIQKEQLIKQRQFQQNKHQIQLKEIDQFWSMENNKIKQISAINYSNLLNEYKATNKTHMNLIQQTQSQINNDKLIIVDLEKKNKVLEQMCAALTAQIQRSLVEIDKNKNDFARISHNHLQSMNEIKFKYENKEKQIKKIQSQLILKTNLIYEQQKSIQLLMKQKQQLISEQIMKFAQNSLRNKSFQPAMNVIIHKFSRQNIQFFNELKVIIQQFQGKKGLTFKETNQQRFTRHIRLTNVIEKIKNKDSDLIAKLVHFNEFIFEIKYQKELLSKKYNQIALQNQKLQKISFYSQRKSSLLKICSKTYVLNFKFVNSSLEQISKEANMNLKALNNQNANVLKDNQSLRAVINQLIQKNKQKQFHLQEMKRQNQKMMKFTSQKNHQGQYYENILKKKDIQIQGLQRQKQRFIKMFNESQVQMNKNIIVQKKPYQGGNAMESSQKSVKYLKTQYEPTYNLKKQNSSYSLTRSLYKI